VFVHVVAVNMVQMSVVQIVEMISVLDARMPALRAVLMAMLLVHFVICLWHCVSFRPSDLQLSISS
jgi:hypothetical protein